MRGYFFQMSKAYHLLDGSAMTAIIASCGVSQLILPWRKLLDYSSCDSDSFGERIEMNCATRFSTQGPADGHYAYLAYRYHDPLSYDAHLRNQLMTRKDVVHQLNSTGSYFSAFVRYFESWFAQVEFSNSQTWNVPSASWKKRSCPWA